MLIQRAPCTCNAANEMCAAYHRLWGAGLQIQILVNPSKASHVLWAFQLHGWRPTNCTTVFDWCVKNWERKYYTYAPWKNTDTKGIHSSIIIACHEQILFRNGCEYAFQVQRGRLSALSLRSIFKYQATVNELKMQTGKCKLLNGNVI